VTVWGRTGVAALKLPKLPAGVHHLEITYSGNSAVAPDTETRTLRVTRAGR
jgi:hypothetical protein